MSVFCERCNESYENSDEHWRCRMADSIEDRDEGAAMAAALVGAFGAKCKACKEDITVWPAATSSKRDKRLRWVFISADLTKHECWKT
jgi:hypothetical protein